MMNGPRTLGWTSCFNKKTWGLKPCNRSRTYVSPRATRATKTGVGASKRQIRSHHRPGPVDPNLIPEERDHMRTIRILVTVLLICVAASFAQTASSPTVAFVYLGGRT